MRNDKHRRPFLFWTLSVGAAIAIVVLLAFDAGAQCQMCQTALTQSAEGQRWARGMNRGIFLLLTTPFMIAGSIALIIYRPHVARSLAKIRSRLGLARDASTQRPTEVSADVNTPMAP